MIDLSTGQTLFSRNEDRRFIPASITKVMTTYLAFEKLEAGELSLNARYPISEAVFEEWYRTGSTMFIPQDATPSVDELLHGITTVSANDASIVLAEGASGTAQNWVAEMNAAARKLGMRNSHFGTPNGWPDDGQTFVSARDLSLLAKALLTRHPKKYGHFFGQTGFEYGGYAQSNHDPISGYVRGADGIKTGYTNEAGFGFLGTAQRDGQRLVMVVAGADTAYVRNSASRSFLQWGFTAFDRPRLFAANVPITAVRVQNSPSERVALSSTRPIYVNIPEGSDGEVSMRVSYEGPLKAPVAKGEVVARLHISVDGLPPHSMPLVAHQAVEKAGPFERIANGIESWLS